MTNPYAAFKTDKAMEMEGIWLDYGIFRVRVRRSGGSNNKYAAALAKALRPYRAQLQAGTLDQTTEQRITAEVFADTVIVTWECKDAKGNWCTGIHNQKGKIEDYATDKVVAILMDLPDLFMDIQMQAGSKRNFQEDLEDDAKN